MGASASSPSSFADLPDTTPEFDEFLLPVQVGKPKRDMLQQTRELLCADGRYTESECRQLSGARDGLQFQRLADAFARGDPGGLDDDRLGRALGL